MPTFTTTYTIPIINKNILLFEGYICHQANCTSIGTKGLVRQIFHKYPNTNIYQQRTGPSQLGTIAITDNIIHLFGQRYPGRPNITDDTTPIRLHAFKTGLVHISRIPNIHNTPLAIPYKIGCGLAGGNWGKYYATLNQWAAYYQLTNVVICKHG